jgi:hypothetical protein
MSQQDVPSSDIPVRDLQDLLLPRLDDDSDELVLDFGRTDTPRTIELDLLLLGNK